MEDGRADWAVAVVTVSWLVVEAEAGVGKKADAEAIVWKSDC